MVSALRSYFKIFASKFKTVNFPLSKALCESHELEFIVFPNVFFRYHSFKMFSHFPFDIFFDIFFDYGLFRIVLFDFQTFGNFRYPLFFYF